MRSLAIKKATKRFRNVAGAVAWVSESDWKKFFILSPGFSVFNLSHLHF